MSPPDYQALFKIWRKGDLTLHVAYTKAPEKIDQIVVTRFKDAGSHR